MAFKGMILVSRRGLFKMSNPWKIGRSFYPKKLEAIVSLPYYKKRKNPVSVWRFSFSLFMLAIACC